MKNHGLHTIIYALLSVLVLASCTGGGGSGKYRAAEGGVWNTTYHVTYRADRDLTDTIIAAMKSVEMSLSPFAEMSLISAINRGDSAIADDNIRRVFTTSVEINKTSGGAFDPTVSPLINLWGYGYRTEGIEPSAGAVDSLLQFVGLRECSITSAGTIVKKHPSTEFNFSAITKGYGCDMVGEALRRNGCDDYMVEIGGEIAVSGMSPRGKDWRIMVDAPIDCDTAIVHERMAVIAVTDCGVATSGNYRNYKMTPEGKTWHTISPVTGRPAVTNLLSATIVGPDCMTADGYATACMAMSADSALAMLGRVPGIEGLLVTRDTILATPGFPKIQK